MPVERELLSIGSQALGLHCSWHVSCFFSCLVLFIFSWGSAKNSQLFATKSREEVIRGSYLSRRAQLAAWP